MGNRDVFSSTITRVNATREPSGETSGLAIHTKLKRSLSRIARLAEEEEDAAACGDADCAALDRIEIWSIRQPASIVNDTKRGTANQHRGPRCGFVYSAKRHCARSEYYSQIGWPQDSRTRKGRASARLSAVCSHPSLECRPLAARPSIVQGNVGSLLWI